MAVVTIRDYGPGIPAGKRDKIFERFYTERPASEGFGTHSGLGLSISRQIATAHGGALVAKTHQEAGAVFTLTLPVAL
jgi:two-component system sensor histidine kinase ChvG